MTDTPQGRSRQPQNPTPRFAADGHGVRILAARPLVESGSRLIALAAGTGSRKLVRSTERLWARTAQRYLRLTIDIDGVDLVDPDEQYVVVPLHEGFCDALALFHLPIGVRFAARDELFEWPALGRYLTAAEHVKVETNSSSGSLRRFMNAAGSVFEAGDSLVVFAQGSILGVEVAFRVGAMRLARRFRRPLLPVVLTGSHLVWEHPFSPTLRFGRRISMRVLDAVQPEDLDQAAFRTLERTMKALAISSAMESPRHFVPEVDGWWDDYDYEIDPDFPDLVERVRSRRQSS